MVTRKSVVAWARWLSAILIGAALLGTTAAGAQEKEGKPKSAELEEAKRLNAEGLRLRDNGKFDDAIQPIKRSLAIREKALGPEHPDVATSLNNLAALYKRKGDYARAEPLYQRSLAIREKALGSEHPVVATSLNDLAVLYHEKGDYTQAETLYQRSLAIREKALGPEHPAVATSLKNLAALYKTKGDYVRAEPLYQRSLAIREKALGPEHPVVATSLNDLAVLYHDKGDYTRAEPLYQRSLAIREKALEAEHPVVATSLNSLAALYDDKGDYTRAEPLYQRSLAIREKALGPEHPDVASSLHNIARLCRNKGDYVRAELLYQRSLAIRERALGPEHPSVARSLNSLALVYTEKGEYAHAQQLYERAVTIQRKELGSEHLALTSSLHNLALLYSIKGDYARADLLSQQSLDILEKARGPEHPQVAFHLHNRAQLFMNKGNYARAEPLFYRSLTIFQKALGPEHPNVATVLNSLAGIYKEKGDYARAEPLFQRALTICEKALGPEHNDVARSLNNLAALYQENGDYARAEPLFQRALTICEKALGPEHPLTATALNNLARLYDAKRDYARAEPLFQRALTIRGKALGPEHPSTATSLHNLAHLYEEKGDYVQAESLLQRSLSIREKVLGAEHPDVANSLNSLSELYLTRRNIYSALYFTARHTSIQDVNATRELAVGSDEQRRAYMNTWDRLTNKAVSLHVQFAPNIDGVKELALTEVLRRKGRVLDAMTDSFASLRQRLDQTEQSQFDQWRSITAQYSALALREVGSVPLDQYRKNLQQLNERRLALERKLSFRSLEFQAVLRPVTFDRVQAALPEAAALVELFRYNPLEKRSGQFWHALRSSRYVAYLLRRDGKVSWVDLGEAEPIEAAAAELLSTLRRAAADAGPPARKLDALVMQPIRRLLGDTRWVFLSPDGALSLVPFAALIDENGHYLIERYSFTYLTSGRELVRLAATKPSRQAPFIAAAPDFGEMVTPSPPSTGTDRNASVTSVDRESNENQRSADLGTQNFASLPAAADEGYTLRQRLRGARLVLGADATEDAIKSLHGPSVLHIATHGFFLSDQKSIQQHGINGLSDSDVDSTSFRSTPLILENPLLRSGLALAGANQRQSGANDGILTALEASQLDLVGTKLVVLSACETGVGEAVGGDGVYGLRRSLAMAGSETQVMSLWKVDDRATRELMEAYYDGLLAGGGRSEAMRQAQLGMLHNPDRASPYFWASFIVLGNPAALDGHPVIPDVAQVKPGIRGCGCEIASGRGGHSEMWTVIVVWLSLTRRRSFGVGASLAVCRRLVRRLGHRAYSAEVTEP